MRLSTGRFAALAAALSFAACGEAGETDSADVAAADTSAAPLVVSSEPPNGPLPDGVRPTYYALDLVVNPDETSFSGTVAISLEFDAPAGSLWMHGTDITVVDATITPRGGDPVVATYEQHHPTGVSYVTFAEDVPAGAAVMTMNYTAPLSDNLAGFFRTEHDGDAYALAKSESIQARRALPSFDEPRFKTPFKISITTFDGDLAISNGPVEETISNDDGSTTYVFAETRPVATYLLSLAVGPFEVVEIDDLPPNAVRDRPLPVRGIARRGKGDELAYVLSITPDYVRLFEEQFGLEFPYQKFDIVAAPDWPSGATELAGAITYREPTILVDGLSPPPGRKRGVVGIHGHELAHMWFGNLVTPPWWDDLWLKESFASWADPVIADIWDPEGGYDLDLVRSGLGAMNSDSLISGRSVKEPITRNEDIRNAYVAAVYNKGPMVIGMFEGYLGKEAFRAALNEYLARNADGVVGSDDFFALMGELTGDADITAAFRGFIEQPGVPVVGVAVSCPAGASPSLTLTQARYKPLGSEIDPNATWAIPLSLRFGSATGAHAERLVMTEVEEVVDLGAAPCPDWVMPNADGAGYYRFSLDDAGWLAIAASFDALSPGEALSAIDSVVAGFEAGDASAEAMFAVLEASAAAERREVVTAPFGAYGGFVGMLDGAARVALRAKVRGLYADRFASLADADTDDALLLRESLEGVLSGTGRDAAVRAGLAARAAAFIGHGQARDPAALSPDAYDKALAVAVRDLGRPFFERLVEARGEIDDARFREASARALGATNDPDLARAAIAHAMADTTSASDTARILPSLMNSIAVREIAWSWMRENFPAYAGKIPVQWTRFTPGMANGFCDTARIAELDALFAAHGELAPGHESSLAQTKERIALCAALKLAKAAELAAALGVPSEG